MLFKALISISCFAAASWLHAQEPFDVSLAYSSADLSPYYRAVIREATERYRGDGTGSIVTTRIHVSGFFGRQNTLEIKEVTGDSDATHYYVIRRSPEGSRAILAEAHFA